MKEGKTMEKKAEEYVKKHKLFSRTDKAFIAGWQEREGEIERLAEENLKAYDKLWNKNEDNKQEIVRLKKWDVMMKEDFDRMYKLSLSRCTREEIENVTKHLKEILNR